MLKAKYYVGLKVESIVSILHGSSHLYLAYFQTF